MKKTLTTLLALAATVAMGTAASAADKLTLQLKWVTQAQFAGYFVAADQGFYAEENLDVTIKPGGPDVSPVQVIAGGGADVVIDWMPSALASREKGVNLVNIAQPFKSSGMMLTCRKDSGISTPEDFKGKRVRGVAAYGDPGARGVYVQGRKIAALGLKVSRGRSYHGLSLNVDMDLSPFAGINPCGYEGLEVTSVARELGADQAVDVSELGERLLYHLEQALPAKA